MFRFSNVTTWKLDKGISLNNIVASMYALFSFKVFPGKLLRKCLVNKPECQFHKEAATAMH